MRARGVVYTSRGFTDAAATRYGTADRAQCLDVGEGARGSVFTGSPHQVATWAFRGHSPSRVLGVGQGRGSCAVFVAESVPRSESDRILRDLTDGTH